MEGVTRSRHSRTTCHIRSSLPSLSLPTCQPPSNNTFNVPSLAHTGEVRIFCHYKMAALNWLASFWYHRHPRGSWCVYTSENNDKMELPDLLGQGPDLGRWRCHQSTAPLSPGPRHSHPIGTGYSRRVFCACIIGGHSPLPWRNRGWSTFPRSRSARL